jgi:transposase
MRLELWLRSAFDLAGAITTFAASTLAAKRRTLERRLAEILTAPTACDVARDLQCKFRGARDQLLTFVAFPGAVEVTNNACERPEKGRAILAHRAEEKGIAAAVPR